MSWARDTELCPGLGRSWFLTKPEDLSSNIQRLLLGWPVTSELGMGPRQGDPGSQRHSGISQSSRNKQLQVHWGTSSGEKM